MVSKPRRKLGLLIYRLVPIAIKWQKFESLYSKQSIKEFSNSCFLAQAKGFFT